MVLIRLSILTGLATNVFSLLFAMEEKMVPGDEETKRPNIILFYVDDMGWQDTSLPFHTKTTRYNRRYVTPNMERLAENGVKFTQAYSSATICQPSRYALMSGQLPAASGYTYNGAGERYAGMVPPAFDPEPIDKVSTLPKTLQKLGYETIQMGKWHIGGSREKYSENILSAGFNRTIAANERGQPESYLAKENFGRSGSPFAVPDLEDYHGKDIFLTEAMTREALKAIWEVAKSNKPFFLFLSHYAIHTPLQRDDRFVAHYRQEGPELAYATMIEGMDKSLGDLLNELEALGIAEETLIFFSSDHGGLSRPPRGPSAYPSGTFPPTGTKDADQSHNYPLRYGKGWTYEGGVRVPMIVAWARPNQSNPLQTVYPVRAGVTENRPVIQLDFFPTLVSAAGGVTPDDLDGQDISSYLSGIPGPERLVKFLWHQPHYRTDHDIPPNTAMRIENWKIIYWYEKEIWELFDLSKDIHEKNNCADSHPEQLSRLARQLIKELKTVGARYPTRLDNGLEIQPQMP